MSARESAYRIRRALEGGNHDVILYRGDAEWALATDAENRRLRKWATECMKMYLSFECDGCAPDEPQCCVCELAAALKRKTKT